MKAVAVHENLMLVLIVARGFGVLSSAMLVAFWSGFGSGGSPKEKHPIMHCPVFPWSYVLTSCPYQMLVQEMGW